MDQIVDTLLDIFTPFATIAFSSDGEDEKVSFKSCRYYYTPHKRSLRGYIGVSLSVGVRPSVGRLMVSR